MSVFNFYNLKKNYPMLTVIRQIIIHK